MANLNEAMIRKDLSKSLNESEEIQQIERPEGVKEWTFADWAGRDMSNETYDRNIEINYTSGITSLKGAPKKVKGDFVLHCPSITSLKGCPEEIDGEFIIGGGLIGSWFKSFEDGPKKVGSLCADNAKLLTLKGIPEIVQDDDILLNGNHLESLEGLPKGIDPKRIKCKDNKLPEIELIADYLGIDGAVVTLKEQQEDVELLEDAVDVLRKYDGEEKAIYAVKDIIKYVKSLKTLDI